MKGISRSLIAVTKACIIDSVFRRESEGNVECLSSQQERDMNADNSISQLSSLISYCHWREISLIFTITSFNGSLFPTVLHDKQVPVDEFSGLRKHVCARVQLIEASTCTQLDI